MAFCENPPRVRFRELPSDDGTPFFGEGGRRALFK